MAPAAKRPAAGQVGSPAKKAARDPVHLKCEEVATAVREASHLSKDCRNALSGTVVNSLGVVAEERHKFQANVVDMIGATLTTCDQSKAAELAALEAKLLGADEEKVSRERTLADATAQFAAKEEDCATKDASFKACSKSVVDLKAALAVVTKAQHKHEKELEAVGAQKQKYDEAMAGSFAKIVNGSWEDVREVKAALKSLMPLCKEVKVDSTLMSSLGSAVEKKPEVRGQFDSVVISQLGDSFTTHVTALSATITGGAEATAAHVVEVAAATAQLETAEAAKAAAEEALGAADGEMPGLKGSLKAADKAVTSFEKDLADMKTEKETAHDSLEEFRAGPLRAFAALKERSAEITQAEGEPAVTFRAFAAPAELGVAA